MGRSLQESVPDSKELLGKELLRSRDNLLQVLRWILTSTSMWGNYPRLRKRNTPIPLILLEEIISGTHIWTKIVLFLPTVVKNDMIRRVTDGILRSLLPSLLWSDTKSLKVGCKRIRQFPNNCISNKLQNFPNTINVSSTEQVKLAVSDIQSKRIRHGKKDNKTLKEKMFKNPEILWMMELVDKNIKGNLDGSVG